MFRSLAFITVLATAAAANAQTAESAPAESVPASQQPAPIVRAYQSSPAPMPNGAPLANQTPESNPAPPPPPPGGSRGPMIRRGRQQEQQGQIVDSQPVAGVWLRSNQASVVRTISATPRGTEIRLERGVLNVSVHHPADHAEILVDLPGGQSSLLKDGLYTFNADTNTVRVLHGEIAAYPGPVGGPVGGPANVAGAVSRLEKPVKVKEAHQLAFNGLPGQVKPVEAYPYEMTADLLPLGNGEGRGYANYSGEDGPYGYPYYAGGWDYPYGYGYPYGGYPFGYGIGIGYYGGFHGGYRGGGFRR